MRYFIFNLVLIIIAVFFLAMKSSLVQSWEEEDYSTFIKFSHKLHIQDVGVECAACHYASKTSKNSSDNLLGDHESCKSCHEDKLSEECGFCHIDPENIVAIKNPVREITFSHEQHISKEIKCETCHENVAQVTYATSANLPVMTTCTNCHNQKKVAVQCETCHNDFAGLIPKDHLVGNFKKDHKRLTRVGELNVSCSTCHTESFCQNCHSGIELKSFGSYKDLMADPAPNVRIKDSPGESKLRQVHDLNYRFNHAVDARAKRLDCYSCHDQQTFCTECHQAGGNINQGKIRPKNHDEAGFKTIGKGSGGGLHAQLAKRDIESCMSCHDVEGADPVCMMCHTENGGVR
jgi:hypothetical protein